MAVVGILLTSFLVTDELWPPGDRSDENIPVHEVSFDIDKCHCCSVEAGRMLVHGSGGRGYGLSSTAITSGTKLFSILCFLKKNQYKHFETILKLYVLYLRLFNFVRSY